MDAAYIKALETRARWLRWAQTEGKQTWADLDRLNSEHSQYVRAFPMYHACLREGDTFFMNKNFGALVEHARGSVPDDLAFDSTWLQAKRGWLWIEQPFTVPTMIQDKELLTRLSAINNIQIKVSAIGWFKVPEGEVTGRGDDSVGGRTAGPGATEFLCFQNFADYAQDGYKKVEGFGCWSYFMLQDGDKVLDRIRQFEGFAVHDGGSYILNRETDMMHEIRWVYSAFYLMAQRLSVQVHHSTDRNTRRRAERDKLTISPFIKIVSLRRLEEDRKKSKTTGPHVEYNWQWEVRGHWRNQFYPSENCHKQIFLEAYIKGPEGKPLKPPGHKIFAAVR